jgi:phage gp16-like protein
LWRVIGRCRSDREHKPKSTQHPARRAGKSQAKSEANGANLGFEENLWQAADEMGRQRIWENRGRGT